MIPPIPLYLVPALRRVALVGAIAMAFLIGRAENVAPSIDWQSWSPEIFEQARAQNRLVLLDLEAGWCHWCHVMHENTYSDPAVIALIRSHYLAVKVDQDSRPDLANRYEDYGWPATIVFGPDGKELAKRQGYIPPKSMASMLQAFIDDPTPGPSALGSDQSASRADAPKPEVSALRRRLLDAYDSKNHGWGSIHKFLDWDIIEYGLAEPNGGPLSELKRMTIEALDVQLALMDPVWGGVYQYSTDGDWKHPHYEKLMQFQAENLRIYALAYAHFGNPVYLQTAKKIRAYLADFLTSPDGAFYTSQDADAVPSEHSAEYFALDDAARRKQGVPRVDQHRYARENGWAIQALTALYSVTGDAKELNSAIVAANWIIANRSLSDGGFRHSETEDAYLGDTLAMGRAFLSLYGVTGDRAWLKRAGEAARFINAKFRGENGFVTSADIGQLIAAPQFDENVAMARFANLLGHFTGNDAEMKMADHAMDYLRQPGIADNRGFQIGGILLADRELSEDPLHFTIVGAKSDPAARALFMAALKSPSTYKQMDWWDRAEGPLPNPNVDYPTLKQAGAFRCTSNACSAPVYSPEELISKFASAADR